MGGLALCLPAQTRTLCVRPHLHACRHVCRNTWTQEHTHKHTHRQRIIYDTQHTSARTKHTQPFDLYILHIQDVSNNNVVKDDSHSRQIYSTLFKQLTGCLHQTQCQMTFLLEKIIPEVKRSQHIHTQRADQSNPPLTPPRQAPPTEHNPLLPPNPQVCKHTYINIH